MFERFTDEGRRVVVLAQEESRLLAHNRIGTEHLLLGLLHTEIEETALALRRAGVTLEAARRDVEQSQGRGKKEPSGHIPFTPRAKKVLELALRVSMRLDGRSIGEPHLLRAILDVPDSTAYLMLARLGVDTEALAHVADQLALEAGEEYGVGWVGFPPSPAGRRSHGLPRRPEYIFGELHDRLIARIEELAVQRAALADAIRRFARHDETCHPERGCTCGLQTVLDRLGPPADPGAVSERPV